VVFTPLNYCCNANRRDPDEQKRRPDHDNSDAESESETSTDDLTARGSLTEGANEAKFLCSLFARFGTTTTRGLRIPAARIRRELSLIPMEPNQLTTVSERWHFRRFILRNRLTTSPNQCVAAAMRLGLITRTRSAVTNI
jgi:hypothetical protein